MRINRLQGAPRRKAASTEHNVHKKTYNTEALEKSHCSEKKSSAHIKRKRKKKTSKESTRDKYGAS